MLPRNTEKSGNLESLTWEDLTNGIPTIVALARLCGIAMCEPPRELPKQSDLSAEAQAILYVARDSGAISIRGDKNAFEPAERFLAICVELGEGRRIEFRCTRDPKQTIRFIDGFRQLCRFGLVMHQLMNDFSLTGQGFDLAARIQSDPIPEVLQFGRETM